MQIWKRTISVFLVLSMVFTMLPVFALAEEAEQPAQAGTVVEELTEASLVDALSEEQELPEQKSSAAYPWDGMTDEEFADWVMAEENRAYIISLFDEDNADTYEALMERIEQIADDDTYSEVCDYLMVLCETEKNSEVKKPDEFSNVKVETPFLTSNQAAYTGIARLSADDFDSKIAILQSQYPNYSTWTDYYDGGHQCWGFARLVADYVYGGSWRNWTQVYSIQNVKQGDILQYGNTSGSGHTVFVTNVSGDTITFVDCNGNGNYSGGTKVRECGIKWGNTISKSGLMFGRYSFSYLLSSPGEVLPPQPTGNFEADTCFSGFLPIELCYTADANTAKIPLYDSNLNQYSLSQRNITNTDDCKILEIYTNGYCKVDYPSGSSRNVEYAKLSDFIPNVNVTAWTADAKYNTYRRSTGYDAVILNSGTSYVDPGDNCLAVGYKDGRTQIIYPSGTGKKMGWIERTYPAATQSQPSGNVEYSTSTDYAGMKSRADAILNYTWTPTQRIATWNGNKYNGRTYFEAGETVSGMPYTLFTSEVTSDSLLSLAQYARKAQSNYSTTAYCNSTGSDRTGPVYGSCCATFVSEVFGGNFMYGENPRYDSVRGIINSPHGTTRYNVPLRDVQPGDALSNTEQHHIIWVSEVTDSTITFYEQTPPIVQKQTISKSSVDGNGYLIYNGATYNIQTKNYVEDTLPTPPTAPVYFEVDMRFVGFLPIELCYTADANTAKIPLYDGNLNQYSLSQRNITNTDDCKILEIYTNGYCKVNYPSGSSRNVEYAKLSDFIPNVNVTAWTADAKHNTYRRSTGYDAVILNSGTSYIDPGDSCLAVGYKDGRTQIIYPSGSGKKMGWIERDFPNQVSLGELAHLNDHFSATLLKYDVWKPLSCSTGREVVLETETLGACQLWKFDKQGDGSYIISSCVDGKTLQIENGNATAGTSIVVGTATGTNYEKWFIYAPGNGAFILKSASSDMVLDVFHGDSEDGTKIEIWDFHGGASQQFGIYYADGMTSPCNISSEVQTDRVTISWGLVPWATVYNVRIFKDTIYTGTEYSQWGVTENSCKVQLPMGHYYAYVDSCNAAFGKQSNIVEFDITECEMPITITPTIPGAAQAGISVSAPEGGWKEGTNTFTVACDKPCVVAVSYDGGQTYVRLTASDATGGKSFTAENMTATTQLAVALKGDSNGDGELTAADLARTNAAILGKIDCGALWPLLADVNQDGEITASDLARLNANILGKISLTW